jgi:hypothetical protein
MDLQRQEGIPQTRYMPVVLDNCHRILIRHRNRHFYSHTLGCPRQIVYLDARTEDAPTQELYINAHMLVTVVPFPCKAGLTVH